MTAFLVTFALVLLALYVLAVFVATYVSLHPPRVPLWISASMLGYPEERVKLDSDGTELTGWWSDGGDGSLAIVCCHGYIMNRCELLPMMVTLADLKASWKPILRGTAIGSFVGALPGAGQTIALFGAYAMERRISATPERFGKGAIEGVAAPEAPNNASAQCAFIPTLTLGIPGSGTMALMLGALMIQGVTPGPRILTSHPELFWGLIALVVLAPIPLGGNRPWAWAFLHSAAFLMLAIWLQLWAAGKASFPRNTKRCVPVPSPTRKSRFTYSTGAVWAEWPGCTACSIRYEPTSWPMVAPTRPVG